MGTYEPKPAAVMTAGSFPVFMTEKPNSSEYRTWHYSVIDALPADWRALRDGIDPPSVAALRARPVPPPATERIADAVTGLGAISATMEQARGTGDCS